MDTYQDWTVPLRTKRGTVVASFRQYADGSSSQTLRNEGQTIVVGVRHLPDDGSVLVGFTFAGQGGTTVGLSRVEALAYIAQLRAAIYPDRIPDELALARQEVAALRRFLDEEVMPRYVEMFTVAGLGQPEDSVIVQRARELLGPASEGTDHP